jgi:hypothetical protein
MESRMPDKHKSKISCAFKQQYEKTPLKNFTVNKEYRKEEAKSCL